MYYALYDNQTGDYMHTGRNATTLASLKDALLGYIQPDIDDDDRDTIENSSVESIAEAWDFTIDTSEIKFADED